MAQVVLENLTKAYPGGFKAVDNISLTINDREFVVFVGPSGCGKSTTLRMIAGLEEITGGSISIDGRRVNDVPPKDRDIAMVFQNYALYPHMTVQKNMAFGLKLRKFPKQEIAQRVAEAAHILGIEPLLNRKPKELSGGQRQRVAVGRAIVRKPKVFLFDEPLSNLDAKMRVQMRTEISKLHTRLASTMIYVTHDQVEAMTMGDRIVVMKDGVIQQEASPLTLYDRPRNMFVAGFIGSPPMNFFYGTIECVQDALWFRETNRSGASIPNSFAIPVLLKRWPSLSKLSGKRIVFGIRPEKVLQSNDPSPPPCSIDATVELVELMGAETYLHLATAGHTFIARLPAHVKVQVGEKVTMQFDAEHGHFFDPGNELSLDRAD